MTDEGDKTLWKQYAKGVHRLGEKETTDKKQQSEPKRNPVLRSEPPIEKTTQAVTPKAPPTPVVLDKRVERNLRHGDVIIEARLDLHGQTLQEAHEKLIAFIQTQAKRDSRLLLVITGKGRGESTLHADLPRWCETSPLMETILAVRPAAPQHGGDGAWYVMLRRQRGAEGER
jgi:DNA-nicking Smr family endonuclease